MLLLLFACQTPPEDSAPAWAGPELTLQDCAANPRDLASLAGPGGLILAIGAAWCAPCQEDAGLLESFYAANPEVGLAAVLVEDANGQPITRLGCQSWVDHYGLSYPVLVDPLFSTAEWVGDGGFPVHLAFSASGELRLNQSGAFDAAALLEALVDE